jgi:hypothetical protein
LLFFVAIQVTIERAWMKRKTVDENEDMDETIILIIKHGGSAGSDKILLRLIGCLGFPSELKECLMPLGHLTSGLQHEGPRGSHRLVVLVIVAYFLG